MSSLSEVNQLITYGRIIVMQVSSEPKTYNCPALKEISAEHSVLLHYVCFTQSKKALLKKAGIAVIDDSLVHIIDKSLKQSSSLKYSSDKFNIF